MHTSGSVASRISRSSWVMALQTPGAVLMTADEPYWRVTRSQGQVQRLADGLGELR